METKSHKFDGLLCRVVATEEQLIGIDLEPHDVNGVFMAIKCGICDVGIFTSKKYNGTPCYEFNGWYVPESFLQLASPLPVELAEDKGVTWDEFYPLPQKSNNPPPNLNNMKEQDVIEGNKAIALFHGAIYRAGKDYYFYDIDTNAEMQAFALKIKARNVASENLKYQSSWDWQIPIYSKLMKAVKEIIVNMDEEDRQRNYFKHLDNYERAIFNDDKEEGFRIIVIVLSWYTTQTQIKNKL